MFTISSLIGTKKHAGRERAVVIDVRDPDKLGRIQVVSPTLGQTGWIDYVMSPGQFTPPKWGDTVFLECEDGDTSYPVAHGKVTNRQRDKEKFTGSLYREVPTVSAVISNGPLFANGVPSNSFGANGFTGHAILLNDGNQVYGQPLSGNTNAGIKILSYGGAKIILSDEGNNQKILIADFNNESTPLSLDTSTGNRILIDSESDIIEVVDINGNFVALTPDFIFINSPNKKVMINGATSVEITSAKCTITTTGDTSITAGGKVDVTASANATVTAAEIHLNGSAGKVLTTVTDPVVDTIFGTPTQGVATVKAG